SPPPTRQPTLPSQPRRPIELPLSSWSSSSLGKTVFPIVETANPRQFRRGTLASGFDDPRRPEDVVKKTSDLRLCFKQKRLGTGDICGARDARDNTVKTGRRLTGIVRTLDAEAQNLGEALVEAAGLPQ